MRRSTISLIKAAGGVSLKNSKKSADVAAATPATVVATSPLFMDYFGYMDRYMQARFDAINEEFNRLKTQSKNGEFPPGGRYYSKTITRSYNSDGDRGEETIVETDSDKGKEVKTVTRRVGKQSIQEVETKDLKTGKIEKSSLRNNVAKAEVGKFQKKWQALENKFLSAADRLFHRSHDVRQAATAQVEDGKQQKK